MRVAIQIAASWEGAYKFVSFSQTALKHASPLEKAHILASKARELERIAFESSLSQEEYTSTCDAAAEINTDTRGSDDGGEAWFDRPLSPAVEPIGRYKHAHHYADGLFSFVYKAQVPDDDSSESRRIASLNPVVALKVTTPSMMTEPHDSEREARILQEASSPQVIALLETFQMAGGRFVLVFPFMPLDFERVLQSGKASQWQVKSHMQDLFKALEFLHSKGMIHRDIKPSNILLKSLSGPAYLADFGIAWSPNDKASEAAHAKITDVGTTCYRPPELLFGNTAYTCALDLWAAGCVVAEAASLWTGKTLFDSGDLGSELALIQSIFKSLGTPDLTCWPEAADLPDWGKMEFKKFPAKPWSALIPKASSDARDLVSQLVMYESRLRLSAKVALEHRYFTT